MWGFGGGFTRGLFDRVWVYLSWVLIGSLVLVVVRYHTSLSYILEIQSGLEDLKGKAHRSATPLYQV